MYEDVTLIHDTRPNYPFKINVSGISYCDGSYKITRNNSNTYCFEYIYEGSGTVCLDNFSFTAVKGDVYWLPAGHNQHYYSSADKPWKKIWFNVKGPLVEDILKNYNMQKINHIQQFNKPDTFEEFLGVIKSGKSHAKITDECSALFLKLVQELSEHTMALGIENNASQQPLLAQKLKDKIDWLNGFDINMDILAAKLFCTKSHAIRVFKKAYGITPYQYILKRKLKDSKTMLANTNYTIKEISDFLHFEDPHSFTQFFKKQTGMAPSEFRKNNTKS